MDLYIYIIQEESILMGNNLDFAVNGNKTGNCIKFILNDLSHYRYFISLVTPQPAFPKCCLYSLKYHE